MVAKRTDLNDEKINKLYVDGMTIQDISKKFNCGFNTVLRRITAKRPIKIKKDSYDWDHKFVMEIKRLDSLSNKDKKIILEFIEDCKTERLSKARIVNYSRLLRTSKRWRNKDLVDMNRDDLKKMMNKIEDEDFAEWSKQGYRIAMKKFYKWVAVEKQGQKLEPKQYPDTVNWINTTIKANKKKLPDDVLNEDDVKKMIDVADTPRNKALICLLWDSGCRIGELLNTKIKDLSFDKYGATITLWGKTGSRKVRLVPSVPYLATLKENHPNKNDFNSFLFVGEGTRNKGQRLLYNAVDSLLRKIKDKAKIKKKVHAHAFRHARASYLASKVKEPVMRELFGWTQQSQMIATYVHLSGRDIDNEKLRADGIEIPEDKEEESKLKPIKCPRCSVMNGSEATFCQKCSMILDEQLAKETEQKEAIAQKVLQRVQTKEVKGNFRDVVKEAIKEMIKEGGIQI